jgi:predicted alpha/beta-hydrolase family hydrolase
MIPGPKPVAISVNEGQQVSGLLTLPPDARACLVLAHGAGAGMTHPFMANVADGLGERGIATLRYQFPYMERRSRRPDAPKVAHAAVRAAVAEASRLAPDLALLAGGKSFGGRMTSQAQADSPLPGVRGLVFLGFPLHPAGSPADERGKHLASVQVWPISACSGRWWRGWAPARPCTCSRRPITRSTCRVERAARMRR